MARLLVVEDSGELAALIAAASISRGHSARTAFSGEAAFQALSAERFDAAIVDLPLPDLPGRDLLTRLAAMNVPSIVVSGVHRGKHLVAEAGGENPVHAFFEKPFPMSALLQSIEALTDVPVSLEGMELTSPGYVLGPEPVTDAMQMAQLQELVDATESPGDDALAGAAVRAATEAAPFDAGVTGALVPGGVPRLFLALASNRESGQLLLRSGSSTYTVELRDGQPVAVHTTRFEDGFVAFCLEHGRIREDALPEIIDLTARGYTPAEAMQQLALLEDADRAALEAAHRKAVLHSAFFWTEGDYALARDPSPGPLPPGTPLPEGLPWDFVLEGLLQPLSLDWLRAALPGDRHLFPTAEAAYANHRVTLTPAQEALLRMADGAKTVDDLRLLADLPEGQLLGTLVAFMHLGFLEERAELTRPRRISYGI